MTTTITKPSGHDVEEAIDRRRMLKLTAASSLTAANVGLLGSVLAPGEAHAAPPHGRLVWADDFNRFDHRKWRKAPDGWNDRYGDIHAWDPKLVTVADSKLRLRVEKRGGRWYGGLVHSRDRAAWTYGYYAIRAKLPAGQGLWSALWLMPQANEYGYWPRSGEIDILEYLGRSGEVRNGYSTIHFGKPGGGHDQRYRAVSGRDWSIGWHTWGCLWDRNRHGREYFRFYVDGRHYGTIDEGDWPAVPGRERGSPFNRAFYLIMNLAVGGGWAGAPSNAIHGKALEIDWVRVYRP